MNIEDRSLAINNQTITHRSCIPYHPSKKSKIIDHTSYINNQSLDNCALCGRQLSEPCNKHHLLPKSKGGKNTPTILIHKICHDKIHAVFKEIELKRYYNTIERLQQNEEITKFIKWVRNKEPEFYDKSVKIKSRITK